MKVHVETAPLRVTFSPETPADNAAFQTLLNTFGRGPLMTVEVADMPAVDGGFGGPSTPGGIRIEFGTPGERYGVLVHALRRACDLAYATEGRQSDIDETNAEVAELRKPVEP